MSYEFLALKKDLPEFPAVLERRSLGGSQVAVCVREGEISVLRATCRHMGASLVNEGRLSELCRVHGVTHRPCDMNLTWSVIEPFVFLGALPADGRQILGTLCWPMRIREFGRFETRGSFTREMWMENTIDLDHVREIHKGGFADVLDTRLARYCLFNGGNSCAEVPVRTEAASGLRRLANIPDQPKFRHATFGPNASLTAFADTFFSVERVSDGHVESVFFVREDFPDTKLAQAFLRFLLASNRRILDEDAQMLAGFDPKAYAAGYLRPGRDDRIAHWRAFPGNWSRASKIWITEQASLS